MGLGFDCNLYSYGLGNSINLLDPFGNHALEALATACWLTGSCIALGVFLGAAAAAILLAVIAYSLSQFIRWVIGQCNRAPAAPPPVIAPQRPLPLPDIIVRQPIPPIRPDRIERPHPVPRPQPRPQIGPVDPFPVPPPVNWEDELVECCLYQCSDDFNDVFGEEVPVGFPCALHIVWGNPPRRCTFRIRFLGRCDQR